MAEIHLVLGGARSGKSAYSEQLALDSADKPHYIATAEAYDKEMKTRIEHHKKDRDSRFLTHEEPLQLPELINTLKWR